MRVERYQQLFADLASRMPDDYLQSLHKKVTQVFTTPTHGDFNRWLQIVDSLPGAITEHQCFNQSVISIGHAAELNEEALKHLNEKLLQLSPWRKGPFELFGCKVDSEWRSDMKWDRLKCHLPPLQGALVLDVGCGNGYFLLRMLAAGAAIAVGVDPSMLFVAQFHGLTGALRVPPPANILPLRFEQMLTDLPVFDCIFSMGVLYHRREPKQHLRELHAMLKPGGYLILESIILDSAEEKCLIPEKRYAGMRNVWHIPSPGLLEEWLAATGFQQIIRADITPTSVEEQRATDWMQTHSLSDFLSANDKTLTIEGHPAPVRGIWVVQK